MRVIFLGASPLTIIAAGSLLRDQHDVVIIEQSAEKIEQLSDQLDCGFIHGDGSQPAVLRDLSPENTDYLFCLTDSDRDNIIASMVAKTLGFKQIVTKLENPDFEQVTSELELIDAIIPDREVARSLCDMIASGGNVELSSSLKDNLSVYTFVAGADAPDTVAGLDLPDEAQVVAVSREDHSMLGKDVSRIQPDDVVTVLCEREVIEKIKKAYGA